MYYCLLFQGKNDYVNATEFYVYMYIAVLSLK